MKKQILLIGDDANTEAWAHQLMSREFDCHRVDTIADALVYMQEEGPHLHVMTQDAPEVGKNKKWSTQLEQFKALDPIDRGPALIHYAREHALIAAMADAPAYLVSNHHEYMPDQQRKEFGISKVVSYRMSEAKLADALSVGHTASKHWSRITTDTRPGATGGGGISPPSEWNR